MRTAMRVLILMAVLLMITAIPAWASQGVGSSPYAADLLVSGLNTGTLDPGQEYWYAYSRWPVESTSRFLILSRLTVGLKIAAARWTTWV